MTNRRPASSLPTRGERERARVLISAYGALEARRNRIEARQARLLAELLELGLAQQARGDRAAEVADDVPVRALAAEVAAVTRMSSRTMTARMGEAWTLRDRFPATMAAFTAGELTRAHAAAVAESGSRLADDDVRAEYERRALPHAVRSTVPATREACRRIAEALEPTTIAERHRAARARRGVFVRDLEDGMAELCLVADAVVVHGARDRLTGMAKTLRRAAHAATGPHATAGSGPDAGTGPADPHSGSADAGTGTAAADAPGADNAGAVTDARTLDQLRADLAADLLLTASPHAHAVHDDTGANMLDGIRGTVQVTIPARSLTGLGTDAAFLAGYGPIDPDTARRLAATAPGWDRLFRSPDTGALLTVDRYEPTAAQRRFLHARDERCRFPGCRQPVHRCDLDHTRARADGGATAVRNLAALCRGHHILKHHSDWQVRQLADGDLEWTSPTGAIYGGPPESSVRFVETEQLATTGTAAGVPAAGGDPPPF